VLAKQLTVKRNEFGAQGGSRLNGFALAARKAVSPAGFGSSR
jgi:hypothetical protein